MNKNAKNVMLAIGVSVVTTFGSLYGYNKWHENQYAGVQSTTSLPMNYASFKEGGNTPGPVDFSAAAEAATPAVVHIKVRIKAKQQTQSQRNSSPFGDLFGDPFGDLFGSPQIQRDQRASGSGVLISADGYIVTNNHVVDQADEIKVTLANKKTFTAKLIGKDANSDLAVLKIDGANFPYLQYGNSDNVKLGQWVLAIGYPLNLDVTVTAGIISAKSRSTGLNKGTAPIDSYLQTDAAINPGNSGGALVNTDGQLIGINSQIASPTGSYAGYAYAIPVNIVKKTITDLIKYGAVQRGYLGIQYSAMQDDDDYKKKFGIKGDINGVYVGGVQADGAAKEAGILKGDIITKLDGQVISGTSDMTAFIAGHKPGDKIATTFLRDGKEKTVTITLKNSVGTLATTTPETAIDKLGGEFATLDENTAHQNKVRGGVKVVKLGTGLLSKTTRMQEGFIIIRANDQTILKVEDLKKILSSANGTVTLEGFYPGDRYTYGYNIDLNGSTSNENGDDQDDDN